MAVVVNEGPAGLAHITPHEAHLAHRLPHTHTSNVSLVKIGSAQPANSPFQGHGVRLQCS